MEKKEFTTRLFDFSRKLDSLRELMIWNYGNTEITREDYLNWEYLENPSGKPVAAVAISSENEVVAQYLVIPINLILEGRRIGGSLSLNTLTREDFRGRGLFTKLAFKAYDASEDLGLKIVYGFPNEHSYPGFVRKLGFKHIGDAPIFFKPLKVVSIFRKKFISSSKVKYGKELLGEECLAEDTNDFRIDPINFEIDKDKYNDFHREFSERYPVMVDRSLNHLVWRYSKVPTRKYHVLKICLESKILATAVIRAREVYGLNSGFIVDFCVLDGPKAEQAGRYLLKSISKYFKRNKIDLIGCMMCKHTIEYRLLKKAGFLTLPKRLLPHNNPVITRVNGELDNGSIVNTLDNWFLTFGDYDVM